jgi:peptidyl-prolyl cis-trans isomerase B (cyclophilin B)
LAGSAKRERQLAREHYERQQARRRETNARRRKLQTVAAVLVAVALVAGGVVWLALAGDDNEGTVATKSKDTPSPSASPSPSPSSSPSETAGAGCTYSKTDQPASKDVGLPSYDPDKAARYKKPFTTTIRTDQGNIKVDMAAADAPCTTNSFRHLAEAGYFDGTSCHRLTTGGIFVLQCGDPTGSGSGGPGYQFGEENLPADEESNYPAGTLAMANAGAGTNGSQFFLVYKDTTLPPNYTIFGTITKGLDVVQKVADAGSDNSNAEGDGKPVQPISIERVTIGKA